MRAKKLRSGFLASSVLLALAGTQPLVAATYVWTGGGNDAYWMDRGLDGTYLNWGNSTTPPGATDDVVFGSGFASGTPNLDGGAFNSLTIDTSAPIELDGGVVRLSSGSLMRTADSSGTQIINMSFFMPGPSPVWDLQGSGGILVSSEILGLNSSQSFTKTGGADLTLGGFSFNAPVTVAGGNLILNGGQGLATFQGGDAPLVTNQGTVLLVKNSGLLATQGQPRIDNGGAVTVTGQGSNWANYDTSSSQGVILVGRDGTGALAISDGAALTTASLVLGSAWTGSGRLDLTSGGQLTATNLSAGDVGGGSASIVVSGNGSIANVGNLTLGTGRPASLSISSGGALNVVPSYPATTASLNLGAGAVVTVDGGSLTVTNVTGQGQINLKSDPVGSSALTIGWGSQKIQTSISGAGSVNVQDGTVFINCNNTYTGQTFINNGEVDLDGGSSSSSFSIGDAYLYLNDGVILSLGSGSITGTRYAWVVYSDVTINGGTISGPFTQTVKKATFNGTTIASDAGMVALGYQPFTLNNVLVAGRLIDNGNLVMNGTAITSTGNVTIAGSVTSNGLQSNGKLSILSNGGGTLSNIGTDLQLNAGRRAGFC